MEKHNLGKKVPSWTRIFKSKLSLKMFLAKMSLIRVKNANMNEGHFHMKGFKPDHILKLKQKITCKRACNIAFEYITII